MSQRSLAFFAFSLVLLGSALAVLRVHWHQQWDDSAEATLEPAALAAEQPDAESVVYPVLATRAPEQDVLATLCADGSLESVDPTGVFVRLVGVSSGAQGMAVARWSERPLAEDVLGANARPDCLFFSGRGTDGGGEVQLGWARGTLDSVASVELRAIVRHPLQWPDRAIAVLLLLGLGVLLVAGQRTEPLAAVGWSIRHMLVALGGFVGVTLFLFVIGLGATRTLALVAGIITFGTYVTVCWVLAERVAPGEPLRALAFHRMGPLTWGVALAVGFVLAVAVTVALALLPRGESPMTGLIQTSAGLVSVLALALVSPWAEELLLRGVVYGALERRAGPLLAVLGSAMIFSVLHLGQHAGDLSTWVMLTVTGLVLSAVRWRTGSTLGSTVAHMVYNLTLALPVLLGD